MHARHLSLLAAVASSRSACFTLCPSAGRARARKVPPQLSMGGGGKKKPFLRPFLRIERRARSSADRPSATGSSASCQPSRSSAQARHLPPDSSHSSVISILASDLHSLDGGPTRHKRREYEDLRSQACPPQPKSPREADVPAGNGPRGPRNTLEHVGPWVADGFSMAPSALLAVHPSESDVTPIVARYGRRYSSPCGAQCSFTCGADGDIWKRHTQPTCCVGHIPGSFFLCAF